MDDENDIDDEESDEDEELTEDIEEVTLMEVQDDGEILVLLDGRRMQVSPADISTAVLYSHSHFRNFRNRRRRNF